MTYLPKELTAPIEFMQPQAEYMTCAELDTADGVFLVPEEYFDDDDPFACVSGCSACPELLEPVRFVLGWFARLSASGYLDCTEWDGPFDTEAKAKNHLIELFGADDPLTDRAESLLGPIDKDH